MKILLICAFLLVGCASPQPDPRLVQPINYLHRRVMFLIEMQRDREITAERCAWFSDHEMRCAKNKDGACHCALANDGHGVARETFAIPGAAEPGDEH